MPIKTLISIEQLIQYRRGSSPNKRIAFVPTMGALHEGHLTLIREAKKKADLVLVSIFVNPTQFGPNEDFAKYPRTLKEDLELLESVEADAVFLPTTADLYPKDFSTYVYNQNKAQILCGISRPQHFQGVLTVVLKLLNLASPHCALFGKKDYQQLFLIKQMVNDLNVPIEICGIETLREPSGLAMSSRNRYLTDEQRKIAAEIYRGLEKLKAIWKAGQKSPQELSHCALSHWQQYPQLKCEYLEIRSQNNLDSLSQVDTPAVVLTAVRLADVRLIDNIELT